MKLFAFNGHLLAKHRITDIYTCYNNRSKKAGIIVELDTGKKYTKWIEDGYYGSITERDLFLNKLVIELQRDD